MRLEIDAVRKVYRGGVVALAGVTLTLEPGVLGLLGPNGAGKSTLMRILATLARPTAGRVLWNGADLARDPDALRAVLGYLPQDFGVYPNLTPQEFLEYLAAARGLRGAAARRRIEALLELVNLGDVRRRPLGGFSGGMRQRVGIAQALLNDPQLLIVDEPTGGLDPEERVRFRNLLADLAGHRIVILSTHIVSDVEAVATRIALLAGGRLLADATPEALLRAAEGRVWETVVGSAELPALRERHRVAALARRSDGALVRLVAESAPTPDARLVTPALEDAYLLHMDRARAGVVAS
jgi:ABC-type multidrug transport system ATPase subunit